MSSQLPQWAAALFTKQAPKGLRLFFSSVRQDYGTPAAFFARLHAVYDFTVDGCAHASNHKLARYWDEADDALSFPWVGERVWLNPPYGRALAVWTKYASEQTGSLVVGLMPARTDTRWFHDHVLPWAELVILVKGRLHFTGGETSDAAPFPSMIVVWAAGRTKRPRSMPRFATMEAKS